MYEPSFYSHFIHVCLFLFFCFTDFGVWVYANFILINMLHLFCCVLLNLCLEFKCNMSIGHLFDGG